MKKILFVVMAAVALMACSSEEGNYAEIPAPERKAIAAATTEITSQFGKSAAKVDTYMKSAGYSKADGLALAFIDFGEDKAPARLKAKMPQVRKAEDDDIEIMYIYGLPEDCESMNEQEAKDYVNGILAKGESFIVVLLQFNYAGKLISTGTAYLVPKSDDVNLHYTAVSRKLHKKIAGYGARYWMGGLSMSMEEDPNASYYADGNMVLVYEEEDDDEFQGKFSDYINELENASIIYAEESGQGYHGYPNHMKGIVYGSTWINPNAEDEAEMRANGLTVPCAIGAIGIGYADYSDLIE